MYRGGFGTLETSEMEFLMTMVNSLKQLGSITKNSTSDDVELLDTPPM